MGSFCSRVANVTLSIKALCYLHGMLWTHSYDGIGKTKTTVSTVYLLLIPYQSI